MRSKSGALASGALAALSALHVNWATGSTWPLSSEGELVDQVVGRPGQAAPSPAACLAVAGLLGIASSLVAGFPRSHPAVSRTGTAGVALIFGVRGGLGLAGRTDLVSPGSASKAFRSRDRRVYGPVCFAIAGLAGYAAIQQTTTKGVR